ncbi:MAG: ATP-binding protein [Promethearchaeota archaeon]
MIIIAFNQPFFIDGTCIRCSKNTKVVNIRYAGISLCDRCFEEYIERKIYKTISKYKLISVKDRVVVALSGGKDSLSLLYNLIKYQERRYRPEPLIALTINEGIGNYREKGIKFAEKMCKAHGIEHVIVSFKEKVGMSLDEIVHLKKQSARYKYACNYCALLKRRILNEEAKRLNADVIAKGHNLTDIAETFLMNILFKRIHLIGSQYPFKMTENRMQAYFVKKIWPLMEIPEDEIYVYALIKKFPFLDELCPNRVKEPIVRKRVFHFIQDFKKFSPEIEFNLYQGFLQLSKLLHKTTPLMPYSHCSQCGYPVKKEKLCSYCNFLKELEESSQEREKP